MLQERSMRGREIEGRRAARKESMDQLMKKAKVLRQTSAGERGSRGRGMRECMRERERESDLRWRASCAKVLALNLQHHDL